MYTYRSGVNSRSYKVLSAATDECPVSLLSSPCDSPPGMPKTGWSVELVNQYFRAERMGKPFGEVRFGTDPRKWPAWFEDAMVIIEREKQAAEAARQTDVARNREAAKHA